jgi:hypothetical protein
MVYGLGYVEPVSPFSALPIDSEIFRRSDLVRRIVGLEREVNMANGMAKFLPQLDTHPLEVSVGREGPKLGLKKVLVEAREIGLESGLWTYTVSGTWGTQILGPCYVRHLCTSYLDKKD